MVDICSADVCCYGCSSVEVEVTSSASSKRSVTGASSSGRGAGGKANVRRIRDVREPSLSVSFPHKVGNYELKIICQPEDQHRARYLTEGSRGTVKDKTQQSHPTVKVHGTVVHVTTLRFLCKTYIIVIICIATQIVFLLSACLCLSVQKLKNNLLEIAVTWFECVLWCEP